MHHFFFHQVLMMLNIRIRYKCVFINVYDNFLANNLELTLF